MKELFKKNIVFIIAIFIIISLVYISFNKGDNTMPDQQGQQNGIPVATESKTGSEESCARLFGKIFDGRLLELKNEYLVLISQEDDKEIKISLVPETKFSEMSFDGSNLNKEKDINFDYLAKLNITDEYRSLSVVSLCTDENSNDCQASKVRLIIESE